MPLFFWEKKRPREAEGRRWVVGNTSGESGSCGHCHSRQHGATRWHVWHHFVVLDFILNRTLRHQNPQALLGGAQHTSELRYEMGIIWQDEHPLPLLRSANSLPGHERQFPISACVQQESDHRLGSLGKAAMPVKTPAASAKWRYPGFDCWYDTTAFAGAQADAGLPSVALVLACQGGWGLFVDWFCVVPKPSQAIWRICPQDIVLWKTGIGVGMC